MSPPSMSPAGTIGAFADRAAGTLRIGLVNNMPDAALRRTEEQFTALLGAATDRPISIVASSLPGIPRGDWGRHYVASAYRPLRELLTDHLDAVVVTGAEPRARAMTDEPSWEAMTGLLDWIGDNAVPAAFSCLAAHAAVLYWDGIAREKLVEKCFGVFGHEVARDHPLVAGTSTRHVLPHSRWNDVPESALVARGYTVLTRSQGAGVGAFTREGPRMDLFFQGHPEYDAGTLLREYRRDVRRYLVGERESYPGQPTNAFGAASRALLDTFEMRARQNRSEAVMAEFPVLPIDDGGPGSWSQTGARMFGNWIGCAVAPSVAPLRHTTLAVETLP